MKVQIDSFPVKKLIKEADAEEEEEKHFIKKKFNERAELVDKKARLNTKKIQIIASVMKHYHGCNH